MTEDTTPAAVKRYAFEWDGMGDFFVRHSDYAALSAQLEATRTQLEEEIRVSNLRGNHIEFDLLPQMADLEMLSKDAYAALSSQLEAVKTERDIAQARSEMWTNQVGAAHAQGKAEGLAEADMWKQRAIHQNYVANAEYAKGKAEGLLEAADIADMYECYICEKEIRALIPADTPITGGRDE